MRLGVLGSSREAGFTHPSSEISDLRLVVVPEQGVQPRDVLALPHDPLATAPRYLDSHGEPILRPLLDEGSVTPESGGHE